MTRVLKLFLALLVCLTWIPLTPAHAQVGTQEEYQCAALSTVAWSELSTKSFVVIYPKEYEYLGQSLFAVYSGTLENEYTALARLFDTSLSLPITARIYPTEQYYYCLNALAPKILPGATHAHIGSREVALIGENIVANLVKWQQDALNAFRYELASLFVEQLTGYKSPPGLLAGLGAYAQDPAFLFSSGQISIVGRARPAETWRFLWENENTLINPDLTLEALTIVAYLVDVYHWPVFLQFLGSLGTHEGYRQALSDVYGVEFSTLQEEWHSYYPLYFQDRWRVHVLYGFDLSAYEQLIAAGAYSDAAQGLREAITLLEELEQPAKLAEANALLLRAKAGQEAGAVALQARQALQNGDYPACIALVEDAQARFTALNDLSRQSELDSYRAWAQEVLDLREGLAEMQAQLPESQDPVSLSQQMIAVSQRLAELGDPAALALASQDIQQMEDRQANRLKEEGQVWAVVCAALVLLRIALAFILKPSQEARL